MSKEANTTRPISEKLADLSQRAKAAEDAFASARADTKQAVDAKLDQARQSIEQLKQRLQQDMSAGAESVRAEWQDVQGRIAKRVDKMKADVAARKQEIAVDRAVTRADIAEDEATAAIADATGAIEYARFAALYAVAARQDADSAHRERRLSEDTDMTRNVSPRV